jgi:hypothetical protein
VSGRKLSDRRLRFRRSRRFPAGRIQLYIEWRDLWWPVFIGKDAVYITLIPIIGIVVLRIARRAEHEQPDPLDHAMFMVWLHAWHPTTLGMTREAKEAALAAVLRHDRWLKTNHGGETYELLTRERLAWWDD